MSTNAVTHLVHVGRQPIYDPTHEVVAYELLFRGGANEVEASRRSVYATTQTIINAFTEFGLEQIVGKRQCFINLTRDFLVGDLPVPFDPGQAVLEIVDNFEIDYEVIAGITKLAGQGYAIAVDDTVLAVGQERLLGVVQYVKVDMLTRTKETAEDVVKLCRRYSGLKLVAERLETDAHLEVAGWLGFDLLQGHALGRPQVLSVQSLSPSRLRRLELLSALNAGDVNIKKIVEIVTGDPGLAFRVLQATNSASTGLLRKVSSVHDAVIMLGMNRIRQWLALMLVSDIAESATDDQLATTMARARLCQTVAERLDVSPDEAFTVGLLSGVAELIGEPLDDLVGRLPLAEDVSEALTSGRGRLGQVLGMVKAYEATDMRTLEQAPVTSAELAKAYLAAIGWSTRTVEGVIGSNAPRRLPPASAIKRNR